MFYDFLKKKMSYSDLCTVVPTVLKQCNFDWISKNGTCYEDSCCMSFETQTSWHYRLAQFSHVVFSLIGIVITFIYASKYHAKIILPTNVRVLLNIILSLIVIHSIDMILLHMYHLQQSLKANISNPCFVRVRVDFCAPFRYTFSCCLIAQTFCLYCLYVDRILCLYWKSYIEYQKLILYVLILQMVVFSLSLIVWIYRNEDSDSYLLSCLNIPLNSMLDLTYVTAAIFPINVICFVLSIYLFRIFQRNEKRSRFDMQRHFKASVDTGSSEFLYRVTATQAFFVVVYPMLSLTMRYFYEVTPRPLHLTIATSIYVFSLYSTTVPLVMVLYVRKSGEVRKEKIWSHVKLKSIGVEGADNYFNSLKSQWG